MKIVQINPVCHASTGKIAVNLSNILSSQGIENYIYYTSGDSECNCAIKYAKEHNIKIMALRSRILGNYGFNSISMTKRLISELKETRPDVIHLHNLHSHNVNLTLLFQYLKSINVKIVWTFHDCWAFTAYCPYFTLSKCNKWIEGCCQCPQKRAFTWFFDRSAELYAKKKEVFTGLHDMTVVTPSKWLANLVRQSFFGEYSIEVIPNGIDLSIYKPALGDFRMKYGLKKKYIVLGVAFDWDRRKGLDVFVSLAKFLNEKFQIVLVGTDDKVDKQLPDNILSIHRTQSQAELAEIYTAADIFVNPTREENYPTVNMEALACGTPVLTFRTGGSPESLDETCGSVVACDDVHTMEEEIVRICTEKPYSEEACLRRAQIFDMFARFEEYIKLYMKENDSI